MCGIAGMLCSEQQQASLEQLRAMIAMVHHRGPDASAVYADRQVGLAHARLSIIDLANGRQPMQTADGALTVTFNGEIYNYIEMRETLIARGHQFCTQSDTEVILHAYAEYGERCVEHFNGQWAFAVWDRSKQQLFLSRDRLGIRPLYYTRAGNTFLFASEIKSLLTHAGVTRALDPAGLNQLLTYWAPLPPKTLFRDVYELPPGHNLVVDHTRRLNSVPYWQLDYETESVQRTADDWSDALRELLTDATRLRLRADVPVGAYLSGGLDSSITTALAQQFTGDRLKTFSITFEDDEFDESEHQRAVVTALGVEHHSLHCSYDDIARVFPEVVWHAEKPMLRTAPAPLQLLAGLVHASDFKVVLTGEGADEILGGYDIFKEAKVRRFFSAQPNSLMRAALFARLYPYLPNLQAQSLAMRRAFFRARSEDLASPFFSHLPRWGMSASLCRLLTPDFQLSSAAAGDYSDLETWLPPRYAQWSLFSQSQFLEASILMPGYILSTQGDRMAMAHSVEGRFPFLDYRVAEFAANVPPRLKMKGINEKYLLKKAFRDLVPDQVARRSKQPYRAPDTRSFFSCDWQSTRAAYVDELLSPERLQSAGVFQPQAVASLLRKIRSGKATGTRDNMALVAILSTQILVDRFLENFPGGPAAAGNLWEAPGESPFVQQPVTS